MAVEPDREVGVRTASIAAARNGSSSRNPPISVERSTSAGSAVTGAGNERDLLEAVRAAEARLGRVADGRLVDQRVVLADNEEPARHGGAGGGRRGWR